MQIDHQIIHCAAFLGMPTERGFSAEGTCFFLNVNRKDRSLLTYLVSARHVVRPFIDNRLKEPNQESIWVRVQRKAGLAPGLFETKRKDWICHHDRFVEICVYPVNWREWDVCGDLDIIALAAPAIIMTPELEEHFGFGLGSDVFIPSVFVGRVGERQNIPVARVGTIAAMPIEPIAYGSPRKPAFLIETKSLGGTSGAPVLFHSDPARRFRRQLLHTDPESGNRVTPYLLIGMVVSAHGGQYSSDFTGDEATENIISKDADFNAGLSVALPVSQILETINADETNKGPSP
jgi:hypothetical protein